MKSTHRIMSFYLPVLKVTIHPSVWSLPQLISVSSEFKKISWATIFKSKIASKFRSNSLVINRKKRVVLNHQAIHPHPSTHISHDDPKPYKRIATKKQSKHFQTVTVPLDKDPHLFTFFKSKCISDFTGQRLMYKQHKLYIMYLLEEKSFLTQGTAT